MPVIGDLFFPRECPDVVCIPMPTAIVRTYTVEGFIIVADGLRFDMESRKEEGDKEQKIFQFDCSTGPLAYSIAGNIAFGPDGGDGFDLLAEMKQALRPEVPSMPASLLDYVDILAERINSRLAEFAGHYPVNAPGDINQGYEIAHVFLDGYYENTPSRASIKFRCKDKQTLLAPRVDPDKNNLGSPLIHGPREITYLLFRTADPRFTRFRRQAMRPEEATLQSAIQEALGYIEACCSPEGREADPECMAVGGHIHIASITPDGFQWVRAPLL